MNADLDVVSSQDMSYVRIFFTLMSVAICGLLCPMWIVAKFVYEPMRKDGLASELQQERSLESIPYAYRYPLIADARSDLVGTKLSNLVIENTPDGYVAMRYSEFEVGFEYWADKNVRYAHLETVARKYVNTFGCPKVYIDRGALLREKLSNLQGEISKNIKAKEEEEKKGDVPRKEGVFASLKTYNTVNKKKTKDKVKITRSDIVCDHANKYVNRGKFHDSKKWMLDSRNSEGAVSSLLSWKQWKKKLSL